MKRKLLIIMSMVFCFLALNQNVNAISVKSSNVSSTIIKSNKGDIEYNSESSNYKENNPVKQSSSNVISNKLPQTGINTDNFKTLVVIIILVIIIGFLSV